MGFILTLTLRPGLVPDAGSLYPLSVSCLDPKLRMDKNLEKEKLHLKNLNTERNWPWLN